MAFSFRPYLLLTTLLIFLGLNIPVSDKGKDYGVSGNGTSPVNYFAYEH
jgi:hypothetical protein